MQKDKIILFDWGNIIEDNLTKPYVLMACAKTLAKCGAMDIKNIYARLDKYKGIKDSKIPTIEKLENWFNFLKEEFSLSCTYQEFINYYYLAWDEVPVFNDVVDFEYSLKGKCQIGILSNLNVLDYHKLVKDLDLTKFDHVFLSFEMEARKPEDDIYELVMQKLKINPQNILFFDDKVENIQTAKKYGWQAYQITGLELAKMQLIAEKFLNEK